MNGGAENRDALIWRLIGEWDTFAKSRRGIVNPAVLGAFEGCAEELRDVMRRSNSPPPPPSNVNRYTGRPVDKNRKPFWADRLVFRLRKLGW